MITMKSTIGLAECISKNMKSIGVSRSTYQLCHKLWGQSEKEIHYSIQDMLLNSDDSFIFFEIISQINGKIFNEIND